MLYRSSVPIFHADFSELQCAVANFSLQLAATKLPASALSSVSDALRVEWLCANASSTQQISERYGARLLKDSLQHSTSRKQSTGAGLGAQATFYVSTTGSDSNPGSLDFPFLTLHRAALAARAVTPRSVGDVTVFIRGGTYRFGSLGALNLNASDSNVTWSACS